MMQITPKALLELRNGECLIIDTRPHYDFATAHIPASINIPYGDNFYELWNLIVDDGVNVVVVAEIGKEALIEKTILKSGFMSLSGILEGGFEAWKKHFPTDIAIVIDISPEEFRIDYLYDEFHLIDVRPEDLYAKSHIEYAENYPIAELITAIADIQITLPIYIYGSNFSDAVVAASIIQYFEIENVRVVNDGFERLVTTEHFPTVSSGANTITDSN